MHLSPRRLRAALVALVCAGVLQVAVPQSEVVAAITYLAVAIGAIVLAIAAVVMDPTLRTRGLLLLIAGFGSWVAADIVWTIETYALKLDFYPVPSDAIYLTGYVVVAAGIMSIVRGRQTGSRFGNFLDITIIGTGASVFVASALLAPLAPMFKDDPFGTIVTGAYPIGDVLLLVMAGQLWTMPARASRAFVYLMAALMAGLIPDVLWAGLFHDVPDRLENAVWLSLYLLFAAACCDPSMGTLINATNDQPGPVASKRRLFLLAIGLLMPACALVVTEHKAAPDGVPWVGIGAILLSVLALLRMGNLLGVVEAQSVQLATLASLDDLTQAPNRRTWDREFHEQCELSAVTGSPLAIAMIDLDHFKGYNDRHGHAAGDNLLKEAVAAWKDMLGEAGMLARYGGEEFAVLMPNMGIDHAVSLIFALREVTPGGQTFSAGVTIWEPGTEPALALAQADRGLYSAKHAGRDRIVAFPLFDATTMPVVPTPYMVFQPIIDLFDGRVAAYEALSRFGHREPAAVFQLAADEGYADLLEARAIVAALETPNRPDLPLHVNASPVALRSERFWALLPRDLTGVVVELSEQYDDAELSSLCRAVDRLRARGALIATDDLGRGSHELLRLATVRPDVVKVDRALIAGCADDTGRQAVIRAGLEFTRALGGELCAEGAKDIADLIRLREIGVRYSQCYLLGEPAAEWAPAQIALPKGMAVIKSLSPPDADLPPNRADDAIAGRRLRAFDRRKPLRVTR